MKRSRSSTLAEERVVTVAARQPLVHGPGRAAGGAAGRALDAVVAGLVAAGTVVAAAVVAPRCCAAMSAAAASGALRALGLS